MSINEVWEGFGEDATVFLLGSKVADSSSTKVDRCGALIIPMGYLTLATIISGVMIAFVHC